MLRVGEELAAAQHPMFRVSVIEMPFEGVSGLTAMASGKDGAIYLGLQRIPPGQLLARYDPRTGDVVDTGVRLPSNKIHNALAIGRDGTLYAGTWSWILVHDSDCRYSDAVGGRLFTYDPATGTTVDLGQPFPHEQIDALILHPDEETLYGVTFPMKRFFAFDLATRTLRDIAELKGPLGDPTSHQIAHDNTGRIWGSQANGTLFCYEPGANTIEETSIRLPAGELQIDSLAHDATNDLLYGGTVQNGILFVFDPNERALHPIAKAAAPSLRRWDKRNVRLPSLAFDDHGRLFGATGTMAARYFMYEPAADRLVDFGQIVEEATGIDAHRIHAMAIDRYGTLYFGESDRQYRPYLYICEPIV